MAELEPIDYSRADSDQRFVESLKRNGFASLVNHPLNMTLIAKIYRDWAAFFATEGKFTFAFNQDKQDGYFSTQEAESAKGHQEQDFKEYFHFYPWGQCPIELKPDLMEYYASAHQLAAILLGWIETYIPSGVSHYFSEPLANMIAHSDMTLLRVLHYPPTASSTNRIRAAAHEDINLLTILPASDSPGLQIMQTPDEWLAVRADPTQVVVNIGDMLQEASCGYLPSTSHRVVTPAGTAREQGRMSLPLFLHPRSEVRLSARHTAKSYLAERLLELGVKTPDR